MEKLTWLIKQSLYLDFRFIKISKWSWKKKVEFLLKKYRLIIKHSYRKFELSRNYIILFGDKIYYDCRFGIAGYQRMLTTHQNLIKIAKIKKAQIIIDVGANVGFFSKLCQEIFPNSRIYAIEPVPLIFDCLKNNFENKNKVKLFNLAISDIKGVSKMDFNSDESAISKLNEDGNIIVKTETLNDFVAQNNITSIDILKIDTETFETHVLRGANKALEMTRIIFIEISLKDNKNYTISSLIKLLCSDKYEFQLIGFRNFADKGEGEIPIMDAVFKNIKFF